MHTAIEELIYQLNCEKNGSSPFVVDSKKMIAGLRENIMKNKDKFEIANMMQELEDYNTILSEHFNQTIL